MKPRFRVFLNDCMYYPNEIIDDDIQQEFSLSMTGVVTEFSHTYDGYYMDVFPDAIVMLSTGLKDKNNREIYEGDIFNVLNADGKIILLKNTVELSDFLGGHYWMIHHDTTPIYEVVGNKYPELPED